MSALSIMSKFERAASVMIAQRATAKEKSSAAKVFLLYLVAYFGMLALIGLGAIELLGHRSEWSFGWIAVGVVVLVASASIMVVFLRALVRGISSGRKNG